MAIFGFFRVLFGTAWRLRKFRKVSDKLRVLSVESFIPAWKILMCTGDNAISWNTPADLDEISEVEIRLGCLLPGELKEFYGVSNGMKLTIGEFANDIVPVAELRYASQYEPPLSEQFEQNWRNLNDVNVSKHLSVISENFLQIIAAEEDAALSFNDVDNMLALHHPVDGKGVLVIVHEGACYSTGTVLEVEGLSATRFENIRSWLASLAATNDMLNPRRCE